MTESEKVRAHIWVQGRVQGVAFRAYVQRNALSIGVTGWVRNVGYDTVEAVGEGPRPLVDEFLKMVKQGPMGSRVDDSREVWEPATGEFESFRVKASL